MAEAAHSRNLSRRQALGFVAGAVAAAVATRIFAADDTSPAAYVALYERYGNIIYWDVSREGREYFSLYFPRGSKQPPIEDLRRFYVAQKLDDDFTGQCIDILKARGQVAGWPKGVTFT